jgi:hypothetical protein
MRVDVEEVKKAQNLELVSEVFQKGWMVWKLFTIGSYPKKI